MNQVYPLVKLGQVISHRNEFIQIDDTQTYKRCRVKLHAQGIILRDVVKGAEIKTKKQQLCKKGEFLVAEIDAKIGGFGIVPENLDKAIVSSHYFLFEINEFLLDRRFLYFFIRTPAFRDQVSSQGSTNYAAIRPNDVLRYIIPLPPLEEQRRIVTRVEELVGKIEGVRSLRQKALEEAEALVDSSARKLLSKINTENTELSCWVDSSRDGIQTGPFGAQLSSHDFLETGVPVLTIGNIQYSGLKLNSLRFVSEDKAQQLNRYVVREGDILFARMGTVGRCCVVPLQAENWLFNYHIIRVALDKKRVDPRFIHWTIRASVDIENYLSKKIRGATREGVNTTIVSSLPCRVPPLSEQHRIVTYLDEFQTKVYTMKRLREEAMKELDALLLSILDKAFKGEL